MDLQEEIKQVEKELVERIVEHLKVNKIAVEIARQQAKDFLALLPIEDQRDLLNKLKGLGDKYEEAKEVYAAELGKVNEIVRVRTLEQMRAYIQQGNLDAAIAAAKSIYPPKVVPIDPAQQQNVASLGTLPAIQAAQSAPLSQVPPPIQQSSIAQAQNPPVQQSVIDKKGGQV